MKMKETSRDKDKEPYVNNKLFLNPERVSYPDIDEDLGDRNKIINYLIDRYGEQNVCQIINFSYITPVVAIKDVGKILGFKYTEMDKLSKKFSYDTFQECLDNNQEFVEKHPEYNELFEIASKLSGRVKTVSCHAGGVGIVDTSINDYMAMKLGSDGEHVIQVDKRIVEEIGIIKFDILGVQTLNMIKEIQIDSGLSDWDLSINNPIFENDKNSYELLCSAMTNGVFQVESAGMKDLLHRLQPTNLGDISAVLALYRPDSMGMLEEYIECKHDPSKIKYIHPDMEDILKETYGCMIYQEQLLEIVRKFGGRSYGGADLFRKGIGKKDEELVKKESEKLYQEIIDNGYTKELARTISNDLKSKGKYGFNKSHSFSYAVLCLQTAYLKANKPLYFFKALFNANKDKVGMVNKYILDAKDFNINVLPPNVDKSEMNFSVYDNSVLFGLSAIKGIGETFATQIISARNPQFKSIPDFIERMQPSKTQMEKLIKSGAFPVKDKRKALIRYLKSLYTPLQFRPVAKAPSYSKLVEDYGMNIEKYRIGAKKYDYNKEAILNEYNRIKEEEFNERQKERFKKHIESNKKYLENEPFWEFEALQIFITDNPFDKAYEYLPKFEDVNDKEKCTLVGVIARVQKKKDKAKKQFAFINIYSTFGLVEGIVWHTQLKEYEDLVKNGTQIAILGRKEGEDKVVVEKIKPYNVWLEQKKKEGVM